MWHKKSKTKFNASAHMRMRKRQNYAKCKKSRAEAWMFKKLKATGLHWTRQAIKGYRLFDFWSHRLGVAVEVDGPEHDPIVDRYKDLQLADQAILVFRVRNWNEQDAAEALARIELAGTWNSRRVPRGLKPIYLAD